MAQMIFECASHANAFLYVGDYSDAQLRRVNRQALALHKYYGLLAQAIIAYTETGCNYLVVPLAAQAGQVLGDEAVAVSTVRYWHIDYASGEEGIFKADERGHYTRELLILEEDLQQKFVKWSLKMAKKSDLSVAAARDYLNDELLNNLEAQSIIKLRCGVHVGMV